jgi:tRNA-dihydrouridine synthase
MLVPTMFDALTLRGTTYRPALFLAPMAGVSHSAFRRLLSDFGGYGALFTEMVSASAFLREDPEQSPFTRRRACEGPVFYQFRIADGEDLPALFRKLERVECAGVDLNLGCPAPEIQARASGCALFRDFGQLRRVVEAIRRHYQGIFTVKIRLGDDPEAWREPFLERLRLFEDCGVDGLTVHPRFSFEKLKRRARWSEYPWIAARTRLPVIGSGDVCCPEDVAGHQELFEPLAGLMLGRIVAVRPWIFREFAGLPKAQVDYREVWDRYYGYVMEDLTPEKAFGRLKEFTFYYAKNFFFGHEMFKGIQKARNPGEIRSAALAFLDASPRLNPSRGLPFS